MSDLYTSYETSVALRDAGAPQEGGDHDWAEQEGTEPMLVRADCFLLPGEVRGPRAFRADEIIDALKQLDLGIDIFNTMNATRWSVDIFTPDGQKENNLYRPDITRDGVSLVEALAAAWLAVLEAERGQGNKEANND